MYTCKNLLCDIYSKAKKNHHKVNSKLHYYRVLEAVSWKAERFKTMFYRKKGVKNKSMCVCNNFFLLFYCVCFSCIPFFSCQVYADGERRLLTNLFGVKKKFKK